MGPRIRLFGITTAVGAATERTVTAPRQRAVLARLALTPGVAVSADQLLTDIWGDDLPTNGAKAVAFQINKLRDLIEPERDGPGTLIATDSAGYRLDAQRGDVDIHEFERLVTAARASLDDPNKTRDLVEDAMGLRRGSPFAGIDERQWVTNHIARLDELQMLAERTLAQARMAVGEHLDVIVDLEQLIRNHPFEEGLVADLMTALAKVGRTADALRSYGDLRIRLSNELGIEPSNDLQTLERRILEGEHSAHSETTVPVSKLPRTTSSFVGRDRELEDVGRALARSPIAVLTGPGGSGKSRVALEYASRHEADFSHGAWFVELAPVSDPGLVMPIIGAAFGLRQGEGASIDDVVRRYLRERHLLLVVDNCEHLLAAAAEAIAEIARIAPGVKIIATSRESLGLPGEQLLPMHPLGLAAGADEDVPAAVRLLLDRANDVGVDARDLVSIARICTRVEGMPLAIELAAARLRTLSPAELADRLEQSLRVLSASSKKAPDRHRTLQATVEWSYSLLTTDEQKLLRDLATFPTSFDLAAAEAVANSPNDSPWELLDLLDSLVDKSLVSSIQSEGSATRYRMLVPVREFAAAELAERGEIDRAALRHASHYAAVTADASSRIRGPGYRRAAVQLHVELNNLRRAVGVFMAQGQPERVIDLVVDLHPFIIHNGHHVEFIDMVLAALNAAPYAEPLHRIRGFWAAAIMQAEITDSGGIEQARAGLAEAQATGDPNLIGRMELALGAAIRHTTLDPEYLEHLVEGRRLLEAHPEPFWWDPTWERGLINLILGAYLPQEDARLAEHFETAISDLDAAGDEVLHAAALGETASLWGVADNEWVLANTRKSVELLEELKVPYWCGHSQIALGFLLMVDGRPLEAIPQFAAAAGQLINCGDIHCWANATGRRADCEMNLGDLDAASHHLAEVLASLPHLPMTRIHQARALDSGPHLMLRLGHPELAARVLGCAQEMPYPHSMLSRPDAQDMLRAELTGVLGPELTTDLLATGSQLDFDAAVELYRHTLR